MKNLGSTVFRKVFDDNTGEVLTQTRTFKNEKIASDYVKHNRLEMGVVHVVD